VLQQGMKDCDHLSTKGAQLLKTAYGRYQELFEYQGDDPPDIDARAKSGMGRVEVCRVLAGDLTRFEAARRDLDFVTRRYDLHPDKTWLRTAASESYAHLGLLHVKRGRTDEAIRCYRRAADLATDEKRVQRFEETLISLGG
jgi:tetratricopeptide (TPR) repeat protein